MRRCPITYRELESSDVDRYSRAGLRQLSPSLTRLEDLPYSAEEQRREAAARATKMSIQGAQPKLSARLAVQDGRFVFVDRGGRWILKPQNPPFEHVPENEDLTMRLARVAGIEVPTHGLVPSRDGTWTYFIRRFDRTGKSGKLALEDFAQLTGKTRETKYDSSMERVAAVLDEYTTFPAVQKLELLKRSLFCFLTGNEDMHLKNFSLIVRRGLVELAPAYDFLNSTIVLPAAQEELALPLHGKKRNLTRNDWLQYYARQRLELEPGAVEYVLGLLADACPAWERMIGESFLPEEAQASYGAVLEERRDRLGV